MIDIYETIYSGGQNYVDTPHKCADVQNRSNPIAIPLQFLLTLVIKSSENPNS